MSLGEDIKRESPSTNRRFLIVPLFNPERRHSWGNVVSHLSTRDADKSITSVTNSPPPPVISITRSSSSSEILSPSVRRFLVEREQKVTQIAPQSTTSFSSNTTRSFPFRCCGQKKPSPHVKSIEQTTTIGYTRRKSSTPSISSSRPSATIVRNHRKTTTKNLITSSSSSTTIATLTKSTKKRRRRGGMASACTSCVSSSHNRRRSSIALDEVTPTLPASSSSHSPISSQTPPLLARLGQIILRRRIVGGTNANNTNTNSTIVNSKIR
ncbi:unnamed protein product [Adineta ricciae]|uniref:Uncharacterized protein n=2 Tax=Adineta ricciae TaxID=249248 RepID=A0A813MVT0_ADIRI|nr:unnamed protein product [Adineta ricciae]